MSPAVQALPKLKRPPFVTTLAGRGDLWLAELGTFMFSAVSAVLTSRYPRQISINLDVRGSTWTITKSHTGPPRAHHVAPFRQMMAQFLLLAPWAACMRSAQPNFSSVHLPKSRKQQQFGTCDLCHVVVREGECDAATAALVVVSYGLSC